MATRRTIRGVLGAFLGTYTSRNSEFDGYWLFGFLVSDVEELLIDLLTPSVDCSDGPLGVAVQSAADRFADQMQKAGLMRSQIREAQLIIHKEPEESTTSINGVSRTGYNLRFTVAAVMEGGRRYERQQTVFVAPHDAAVELQST